MLSELFEFDMLDWTPIMLECFSTYFYRIWPSIQPVSKYKSFADPF